MATCIMYHGIVNSNPMGQVTSTEFEEQIVFLKKFCRFLTPSEFFERKRSSSFKMDVLLTFDDGYKNNLHIVTPILMRHKVPAIFFACVRHAEQDKYLWSTYLRAVDKFYQGDTLEFAGQKFLMADGARSTSLKTMQTFFIEAGGQPERLRELLDSAPRIEDFVDNDDLNEHFRGLSAAELRELASLPLFEVGSHTIDHPFLSRCSDADIEAQMVTSKKNLEAMIGKSIRYFAYPSGDYDQRGLDCARRNYDAAFSVGQTLSSDPQHEIRRFGIYRPEFLPLIVKTIFGKTLRGLGREIG